MWNWKPFYDDDNISAFCDLDQIVDTEADENGYYSGPDCYRALPPRFGVFVSVVLKNKDDIARYLEERKNRSLPMKGYKSYRYSLCLAEIDARQMTSRVLPAGDYDVKDRELGDTCVITDVTPAILPGINEEWKPIRSKKTHRMIRELAKMFFPKE
ncbi:MAG: hypothetical protein KA801_01645 [Syntrophorhabdaceae bacterium]|nr:hypothetical protein [Syntrophorhabdaceae bacterium]